MFSLILFCIIASAVEALQVNIADLKLDNRVEGGIAADISSYPYQLSLRHEETPVCGAVLISEYWALTAAHTFGRTSIPSLNVGFASSYIADAQRVTVSGLLFHEKFNSNLMDYDIALVLLSSPLTLGPNVAPIALAPADYEILPGNVGVITGWGVTESSSYQAQLQATLAPIVDTSVCSNFYGDYFMTETKFCGADANGQRQYGRGDVGGPFVIDGVLVGLMGWSGGISSTSYPGVFISIPSMRDWITTVTGI